MALIERRRGDYVSCRLDKVDTKKRERETWKDWALRIGQAHRVKGEVLIRYLNLTKAGFDEQFAAEYAVLEWC